MKKLLAQRLIKAKDLDFLNKCRRYEPKIKVKDDGTNILSKSRLFNPKLGFHTPLEHPYGKDSKLKEHLKLPN